MTVASNAVRMLHLSCINSSPTQIISGYSHPAYWSLRSPKMQLANPPLCRKKSLTVDANYSSPIPLPKRYVLDGKCAPTETLMSCIIFAIDTLSMEPVALKVNFDVSAARKELRLYNLLKEKKVSHVAEILDNFSVSTLCKPSDKEATEEGEFLVLVFPRFARIPMRMDLLQIRNYMLQLFTALTQLHKIGIWHMDVTLANLMIDPRSNELVLIDFGLAMELSSSSPLPACGTVGYVDPELKFLDKIPKSKDAEHGFPDVYSAGCVFGQWLHPFISKCSLNLLGARHGGHSTSEKVVELLSEQLASVEMLEWPEVLCDAAQLVHRMLQQTWSERISSSQVLEHRFTTSSAENFECLSLTNWVRKLHIKTAATHKGKGKNSNNASPVSVMAEDRCRSPVIASGYYRRQEIYITYR